VNKLPDDILKRIKINGSNEQVSLSEVPPSSISGGTSKIIIV
jgi:hypothetical protein